MALYNYKARDGQGKFTKGSMEAVSEAELIDKLNKMGYMVTGVSQAKAKTLKMSIFERLRGVSSDDMLLFYVQLSNMINANLSILVSLSTVAGQIKNKKLKEAIANISRRVEAGNTVSQSFSGQAHIFNKLFVNMLKAGETSGSLDTVLMRYANFFEREVELKQKIKGALFYPTMLLVAGVAVLVFIVTFVIPHFIQVYLKTGVKLPIPTLVVYKTGIAIKHYWYLVIAAVFAILFGIMHYFKTERGSFLIDRLKLKLFIIGQLFRKIAISRFARTLATLLASGVGIVEALDITKEVIGNQVLSNVIGDVRKSVEKGERIAPTLSASKEFPADVIQMISVGEGSGSLVEMLNKIADFYDRSVGYAVNKLTTVIEPLFLLIMGVMVGFIIASMLMPMFDMIKLLRQ